MKILYIVPNVTGLNEFFRTGHLVDKGMPSMFKPLKYFAENGHLISIFVYPYYNDFTTKVPIKKSNIQITYLDLPNENILLKILRKCSFSTINLHPLIEVISLVKQILQQKKIYFKIVYGHDFIGILTGYFISRLFSVPLVSRIYGASFMRRANGKLWFLNKVKYWEKYLPLKIKSDCLLITNDGSISYQELKQIKPYSKNYKLWFNGYDNISINKKNKLTKDKIFTLISVSALSNWKNVDVVIDVFNYLLKKSCDARLLIIGDGSEKTALKRYVKKYNIDDKVTFTGRIQQKEVYVYLNKSDVFLNLYDRQNLTNTLWEAMSMGKCVITRSEYDNTREIIKHGENGYLFPINEKEKIVDCLVKLYNDRALLDKIGSKGKETVEKTLPTWDERVQREYKLIKNITEGSMIT